MGGIIDAIQKEIRHQRAKGNAVSVRDIVQHRTEEKAAGLVVMHFDIILKSVHCDHEDAPAAGSTGDGNANGSNDAYTNFDHPVS